MNKIIAMIISGILCCSFLSFNVSAIELKLDDSEKNSATWDKFLKYDLCITDYDSLTDEQKDLAKFIFETETNSEETIICERARRILDDYDVGRRVTLEDTENYYDFADYAYLYSYLFDNDRYEAPYLCAVPDIKHLNKDEDYNEYWIDDSGKKKILSTGEAYKSQNTEYLDVYKYIEQDENGKIITSKDIKRYSIHFKTISDECFTYVIYPDDTLYVQKVNKHVINWKIPEEVNGMKVVGIKKGAFINEGCVNVKLPESIEYIEPVAFSGCDWLENINIPKNLKYLGHDSFWACTSLKNISVDCPDLICTSAFGGCYADSVFLNYKYIRTVMLSTLKGAKNITFGNDVVKMGGLWTNSRLMSEYNYQIPKSVKCITDDCFCAYNEYYSDALTVPATVEIFSAYTFIPYMEIEKYKCYLSPETVIQGYKNTEAQRYAQEWKLTFVALDEGTTDTIIGTTNENGDIYGDVDGNGEVGITDAVLVMSFVTNKKKYELSESTQQIADVYCKGDGINNMDALEIRKYLADII